MRDHMNPEERAAAQLLDAVRLGFEVPQADIDRALWILGDLVGAA